MWYIHTTGYYSALKSLFSHSGYHMPNRLGDVFAQKGGGCQETPTHWQQEHGAVASIPARGQVLGGG